MLWGYKTQTHRPKPGVKNRRTDPKPDKTQNLATILTGTLTYRITELIVTRPTSKVT